MLREAVNAKLTTVCDGGPTQSGTRAVVSRAGSIARKVKLFDAL